MSKEKAIIHINNVSKILGTKRIKISEGTAKHLQNELYLVKKGGLSMILNKFKLIEEK